MKQGSKFIQGLRLMGFSSTLIWYYLHKQNKEQTDKHISYIYIYITLRLKQTWRLTKAIAEMKSVTEQTMKLI